MHENNWHEATNIFSIEDSIHVMLAQDKNILIDVLKALRFLSTPLKER
jgi:hypothetical protein